MSDCDVSRSHQHQSDHSIFICGSCDDDDRHLKRREKNRVAAQRSRKRWTQRANLLHEAYEHLEQRNNQLRQEVVSLSEEQRLLAEVLRTHEPCCPIMHCSGSASSSSSSLVPRPAGDVFTCNKGDGDEVTG